MLEKPYVLSRDSGKNTWQDSPPIHNKKWLCEILVLEKNGNSLNDFCDFSGKKYFLKAKGQEMIDYVNTDQKQAKYMNIR